MSQKLLLLVILALLSLSLGRQAQRTQKRQQSTATTDPATTLPAGRTAQDIQLDAELARWQEWLSSIVLVPSDLQEVSTILVNHRLDVPAIRKLQVSDLTAAGIELGDAQRIVLKAAETVDPAPAVDANQPVVLAITVPTTPQPPVVATPAVPVVPATPAPVDDGWTTFLTGVVASTDINALANKLRLNKLTPADLPLVSLAEMQSLGVPFGDAKRILAKAQQNLGAPGLPIVSPAVAQTLARRSFRKRQVNTIDRAWLNDVVVDPKDIDTILNVLTAHRIISLGDLLTLQVSDLVGIGLSLGDASRMLKKVAGMAAAADATTIVNTAATTAAAVPPAVPAAAPATNNATTNVTVSIAGDSVTGKTISIEFAVPIDTLLNATVNNTVAPVVTAADATATAVAVPAVVQAVTDTPTVIVAANPVNARKRFIRSPLVRQLRDIRPMRPRRFVGRR